VSTGPGIGAFSFRAAYASALADYVRDSTEYSLHAAYELGRDAVSRQLSVLDLAVTHQEALLATLREASGPAEVEHAAAAAGDFFLESLSSFDMIGRGFDEAREAARLERRQAAMSRQLSTFLADASLALDASESLEEMLRLVAEQARELVGARCCLATVGLQGQPRTAEAASYEDRRLQAFVRWIDLPAILAVLRGRGGAVRLAGGELAALPPFRTAGPVGSVPEGWLAASLTALDGAELGAIQLFDKEAGSFTADDEAVLLHLAQMASAAVERSLLYERP
jgi:Phosphoserine phosphatase RsbU, N-terminal domain